MDLQVGLPLDPALGVGPGDTPRVGFGGAPRLEILLEESPRVDLVEVMQIYTAPVLGGGQV